MRPEDMEMMSKTFPKWKELTKNINGITIHSPSQFECDLISKLFPNSWYETTGKDFWNLNEPAKNVNDLIVASNVFMYLEDPATCFKNVLASCKYFWIQDLVRSARMPDSEVANGPGGDGDCMRYFLPPDYARYEKAFDLSALRDRIVEYISYPTVGRPDKDSLSFIAFFKGDL